MIAITEGSETYVSSKYSIKNNFESYTILPKSFSSVALRSVEAIVSYLERSYGCTGYVIVENNERAKVVCQKGTFSPGGVLYVGPEYVAYGYILSSNAITFINDREAIMNCSFVSLTPRVVPSTPFSQISGLLPLAVGWSGGCLLEYFTSNYLNADSYSINSKGQITQAYGLKGGTLGMDFIPSSKYGGLVSLLSKARSGQLSISLDDNQGVIPSRTATASIIRSIKEGTPINLGWVKKYNKPLSKAVTSVASLFLVSRYDSAVFRADSSVTLLYCNRNGIVGSKIREFYNALISSRNAEGIVIDPSVAIDLYMAPSQEMLEVFDELYNAEKSRLQLEQSQVLINVIGGFSLELRQRMSEMNFQLLEIPVEHSEEGDTPIYDTKIEFDSFAPIEPYRIPLSAQTIDEVREKAAEFEEKYGALATYIPGNGEDIPPSLTINEERMASFQSHLSDEVEEVKRKNLALLGKFNGVGLNPSFIIPSSENVGDVQEHVDVKSVECYAQAQSEYYSWLSREGFNREAGQSGIYNTRIDHDESCEFAWHNDIFGGKDSDATCRSFDQFLRRLSATRNVEVFDDEQYDWGNNHNAWSSLRCKSFVISSSSSTGYTITSEVSWTPLLYQHLKLGSYIMGELGRKILEITSYKVLGDNIKVNVDLNSTKTLSESMDRCMNGDRYYGGSGLWCGPRPKGMKGGSLANVFAWSWGNISDPHHKERIMGPGKEYVYNLTIRVSYNLLTPIEEDRAAFEQMYRSSADLISRALSEWTLTWLAENVGLTGDMALCSYDSSSKISDIAASSVVHTLNTSPELVRRYVDAFGNFSVPSEVSPDVATTTASLKAGLLSVKSDANDGRVGKNDLGWYGASPSVDGTPDESLFIAQMELT